MSKTLMQEKIDALNCEVQRLIRELRQQGKVVRINSVERLAARQPAPRFYVTPIRAIIIANRIRRGESLGNMTKMKQKMYRDIYDRYMEAIESNDNIEFKIDIIERIVSSPAPSFYIEDNNVHRILNWHFNKHKHKTL